MKVRRLIINLKYMNISIFKSLLEGEERRNLKILSPYYVKVLYTCYFIYSSKQSYEVKIQFSSVQSLSRVRLFATPWSFSILLTRKIWLKEIAHLRPQNSYGCILCLNLFGLISICWMEAGIQVWKKTVMKGWDVLPASLEALAFLHCFVCDSLF